MPPVIYWSVIPAAFAALVLILVIRMVRFSRSYAQQPTPAAIPEGLEAAEKLARAVRYETLCARGQEPGPAFSAYHQAMEELFPLFHGQCERTVIGGGSLVYRWPSPNHEPGTLPLLITAHIDVVPVEPGTGGDWLHGPFSGDIADGRVWGRGTLDTKIHMITAMEAAERLIAQGYAPRRDVWFAFGHDEEVGGEGGALRIVEFFKQRDLRFAMTVDEGGCIVDNVLPGVSRPIALIGVGEKGYADIRLSAAGAGGHASMPPRHSAVGFIAQAVCRLESHPFKTRLIPPVKAFLMKVGPQMGGAVRFVLANLWLFTPLFKKIFSAGATGSAMVRTTLAVTMAEGSPAANVLPQRAAAMVNCRILPWQTGQDVLAHFNRVLKGLPVTVEALISNDPSAISPTDCDSYRLLEAQAGAVCPDAVITPYLVMAATDARKYEPVCDHIYRFTPYRIDNSDLKKVHGTNENITVENVNRCVAFFTGLIRGE